MLFNSAKVLVQRDGRPVIEPKVGDDGKIVEGEFTTLTHGIVAVRALDSKLPGDENIKPEDVRKRWILGAKILGGELVELTATEASLITDRLVHFGTAIAGPIIYALDNPPAKAVVPEPTAVEVRN